MRRMPVLFGAALLISAPGFAENTIATKDYVADPDLVLETAVKEVKAVPADAVNLAKGISEFAQDEAVGFVEESKAAFADGTTLQQVHASGLSAVEAAWEDALVFRSYKVSDEIGALLLSSAGSEGSLVDVSGFFADVEFEGDESAFFQTGMNRLLVRQTRLDLLQIESVLAEYQGAERELMGHQVQIETKFVEVSQTTLDELGFTWSIGRASGEDLSLVGGWALENGSDLLTGGLRTASDAISGAQDAGSALISKTTGSLNWNMFVSALEQADDSDVLSSPRVVARDGSTAIINVGEEQMLPMSFEANNQDTSPILEYGDWELSTMGVRMEVTPEIREEGLIDLSLHPVVKDLIGYDPYSITPDHSVQFSDDGVVTESIAISALNARLPYYRLRELETRVTVADGSTLGMGGLTYDKVETFRDKVPMLGSIPFLGRLFRSEGERSVKRNLMIFVTATQVDLNGQTTAELALKK